MSSEFSFSFWATLDGYAMPSTYLKSLQNGPANDVPIITGNTKDESGANYGQVENRTEYYSFLNETQLDLEFLALYPPDNSTSATGAYDSPFTDRSKVGTWLWANLWHPAASSPVYTYFWDHAPPNQTRGAYHESEINYVLNNLYDTDSAWTTEDYEIAAKMNGYWANFIKTGNPNGKNLPSWNATGVEPVVHHVGNGWCPIPVAPASKISLFEAWFDSLPAY
ncbi:hypothetical protein LTS07_007357 [Exophiala sideris]|nr:hypothetical protein LTS07_007357 [Exophiala sideris]KAK5034062.1 hypothetical protein LTR13_006662 [Exophiala sideris]KAK5181004.1 hypothetical protein LTR44_006824 [Eurotiomycetes sp. CCFEE 6388]